MIHRGSQIRETLQEAGYVVVGYLPNREELLVRDVELNKLEVFIQNDNHSGWTLEIDGQGYEFVRSATVQDIMNFV